VDYSLLLLLIIMAYSFANSGGLKG